MYVKTVAISDLSQYPNVTVSFNLPGGSRGIGYETALDLAKRGAEIIIAGIDFDEVRKLFRST